MLFVPSAKAGSRARADWSWLAVTVAAAAMLNGCTAGGATAPRTANAAPVAPGMQYLYGSGEAAALSQQAYAALTAYVRQRVRTRPIDSVVLDQTATLAAPHFVSCGTKPYAVVFDVDETVLLNRGFEYDVAAGDPYSEASWRAYEVSGGATTVAVPGARAALSALRAAGVTVVFNTNRSAANAAATRATIERAGLGPAVHGATLFLQGDDTMGSLKDARRRRIADRFCVIAMAGDQLGDFSDLFNVTANGAAPTPAVRRGETLSEPIAAKWGAGWFVLPNPVYGTALKGGIDDVFPPDTRWAPRP